MHKLCGITEGSWLNITSLYSYLFHHNYILNEPIDFEIAYIDFFLDEDFRYPHWEQEETWLEQQEYIFNLLEYKPPHKNKITFKKVSWQEHEKIKLYKYGRGAIELKKTKWGINRAKKQHGYAMAWPIKNNLQRIKNKVCIFRPSFTKLCEHRTVYEKQTIEKTFLTKTNKREQDYDWDLWADRLKKNYDVVEIEYRTPIREAVYHLSTCEFCFSGTGGIAQTLSVGLQTPTLVFGFKKSCNENFDDMVPLEDFNLCGDKSYIEGRVNKARENMQDFLPSLEMLGVPINVS